MFKINKELFLLYKQYMAFLRKQPKQDIQQIHFGSLNGQLTLKIFIVIIALLCNSCTSKQDQSDTLQIAITSRPQTLDPRFATDANGQYITQLLFSSLVRIGPKLKPINDAAKSWTYNNLTYTFQLHKGLTFSNGTPVTQDDLLFTFHQYTTKGPFKSTLHFIKEYKVSDHDDHLQVQILLSEFRDPLSFFADLSVVKILPKAIVTKYKDDFSKHLIGSGHFAIEKQSSLEIVLRARKQHHSKIPKINRVVFKIIRNDNTLYFKALKGELDIIQSEMPTHKIKEFIDNTSFQVFKYPGLKVSYLLLNLRDSALSHANVRRAIATAFNRDEIIQYKLSGLAKPATSFLTPGHPFFPNKIIPLKYDLQSSKKTFSQLKLPSISLKTSNKPSSVEVGKVMINQLLKAGLNVQLQSFEWATYYSDIQAGRFQMAMMTWVGVISPDIYRIALHSLEIPPKGRNRGFYKNKLLDQFLELGSQTESLQERKKIYQKVQEIIMNDLPIIPLWYHTDVSIVHKRVVNYQPSLNGDFTPLVYVEKQQTL